MKKILVIRFSSIGDIVLTTPVVRCIKQQLPDAEVHYLTKRSYANLVEHNPYIDKVHTINIKVGEIAKELKAERFDYVIDLHKNTRSLFVKMHLLGISKKSFEKLNYKKWLLVCFKRNTLPPVHIVDRYLDTASELNIQNDQQGLDYFIPDHEQVHLSELPPQHQNGYIALALGSKHYTKQITTAKLIELCKAIDQPIVLLGGQQDTDKAAEIVQVIGERVFNASGIYNINQSASLVQQAQLLITPDTGLMHIAAAFNKKIISIWGNTVPAFGMYPYLSKDHTSNAHIIEVSNLKCRPCSKLGHKKCPKGHFKCINDIDMIKVAELAKSII